MLTTETIQQLLTTMKGNLRTARDEAHEATANYNAALLRMKNARANITGITHSISDGVNALTEVLMDTMALGDCFDKAIEAVDALEPIEIDDSEIDFGDDEAIEPLRGQV